MHRYLGDASDDADARTHEPGEIRDLARHVEADLDHRHLVARLDAEEGQRDADLVVERRLASQHAITYAERGRGRLLRRRLPDVPGDADRRNRMGVAQRGRQDAPRREPRQNRFSGGEPRARRLREDERRDSDDGERHDRTQPYGQLELRGEPQHVDRAEQRTGCRVRRFASRTRRRRIALPRSPRRG